VSDPDLGFVHRLVPADEAVGSPAPALLLLHGTGGDEDDLLPLGRALAPGWALLSPRGKVLENGAPRFFRRLAEGVFDLDDLVARTHELADFAAAAVERHGLDRGRIVAVGFSNGANIAASLLLLRPGTLAGALLLRAMVPLEPEQAPDLSGIAVLMAVGARDPLVPRDSTRRLAELLEEAGAEVAVHVEQGAGHGLAQGDLEAARGWLAERFGTGAIPASSG
jgi:phospholipase/carboxylesterase